MSAHGATYIDRVADQPAVAHNSIVPSETFWLTPNPY
jgi:hypothetical protein